MESPISLSATSHSPPASERSESPSNVHDPGAGWGANASDIWGQEQTSSWGHAYTSNWGTEHLTRSTVLQTVRSDFQAANLTATGTDERNTSLDHLDNRAWSSIQLYRSSEQGRRDHAPFPSFTLPQVEQRYQEVQASIRTRLQQKELLADEIEVLAQKLADKKKKAKEIEDDLLFLRFAREELRDLHVIAHARLPNKGQSKKYSRSKVSPEISETGHIPLRLTSHPSTISPSTRTLVDDRMSGEQKKYDRPKFEISLAEFLRKGLNAKDYAKYKPTTDSQSSEPSADLTPQQMARKRYEERNKEHRVSGIPVLDEGLLILKTRDISKRYTKNTTARRIVKNVGMAKIVVDHSVISKDGAQGLLPAIANVVMGVYNDPRTTQFKYLK
ncbi:hypothetical protein EV360DRAFT_89240 [Lentinula raphanica]|nr:hypothetical protein EV360DRAFT_89240 [Lentinula raphanica]